MAAENSQTLQRGEGGLEELGRELEERFRKVRELGERGVFQIVHPGTREHIDVVDFDLEIARREELGLEAFGFWHAPLPEVDK